MSELFSLRISDVLLRESHKKVYGLELFLLKHLGFIKEEKGIYELTLKGAFYYHHYENYYTLAYIDKMWGLMREVPFPKEMKL